MLKQRSNRHRLRDIDFKTAPYLKRRAKWNYKNNSLHVVYECIFYFPLFNQPTSCTISRSSHRRERNSGVLKLEWITGPKQYLLDPFKHRHTSHVSNAKWMKTARYQFFWYLQVGILISRCLLKLSALPHTIPLSKFVYKIILKVNHW